MAEIKRRKIVKRVYEKGRETEVSSAKPNSIKGNIRKALSLTEKQKSALGNFKNKKPIEKKQAIKPAENKIYCSPGKEIAVDNYELPRDYGVSRLTLMVKDPFWIFAYWDIPNSAIESLRKTIIDSEKAGITLRMYDVTCLDFDGHNANRYFDIDVGYNSSNWYVNLWNDGVSYIGEIGLKMPDGRFFSLARSNCVQTPRISYSPRTEQIWMKVTPDSHEKNPFIMPGAQLSGYDKKLQSRAQQQDTAGRKKRAIMYLNEEEIRNYYSKLTPLLRDIISERLMRLYGKKAGKYAFLLEGESEVERERLFSFLPKKGFMKRMRTGASEELVIFGGASEQLSSGAVSSFVQAKIKERKFFFEIGTELIVYGRTEPDAEVFMGDKKVHLRKDGTFSLRFALPDGKIPMEFRAISNDKQETRKINTYVDRNTIHPK